VELFVDVATWVCLSLGVFFAVTGGIGIVRLPDFFSRMHGSGLTDTMGTTFLVLALMLQAGLSLATVKLFMILLLILLTSPTSAHALARAALTHGLKPWVGPAKEKPSNR